MDQDNLYTLAGIIMFGIGIYGVITVSHVIRKLIAINIMGIGVFMVLLATASHENQVDPIPHAMVLTGIIVAVAGTALCLSLVLQIKAIMDNSDGENSE